MLRKLLGLSERPKPVRKQSKMFLDVLSSFYKLNAPLEGSTITGWNIYPEISTKQLTGRVGRAVIKIYTDRGTLELNTSDCDIEVTFKKEEKE